MEKDIEFLMSRDANIYPSIAFKLLQYAKGNIDEALAIFRSNLRLVKQMESDDYCYTEEITQSQPIVSIYEEEKEEEELIEEEKTKEQWELEMLFELEASKIQSKYPLYPCQRRALGIITHYARIESDKAYEILKIRIVKMGFDEETLGPTLEWIRKAPIDINFSPFKTVKGKQLIHSFLSSDRLLNLFETKHGCGGNDVNYRRKIEDKIFGDSYGWKPCVDNKCPESHRPKYGVLNVLACKDGVHSAFGYGDCYFRLKDYMKRCTTYCEGDSFGRRFQDMGTSEYYCHILNRYNDKDLARILLVGPTGILGGELRPDEINHLNSYKEAQIHSEIYLDRDIECIVISKKYSGNELLEKLAKKCNCRIELKNI